MLSETCPPSSHDVKQAISIKVEEGSDIEEEENLVPLTYPGVEADHEVRQNCVLSLFICVSLSI